MLQQLPDKPQLLTNTAAWKELSIRKQIWKSTEMSLMSKLAFFLYTNDLH